MIYLKSVLAGIGGSLLGIILLVIVIVILNARYANQSVMVGINVVGPIPIAVVSLGFILGFYMVFRNSLR